MDTELQLIGQDDEYSYFNVYVKGKLDHVVCIQRVKQLRPNAEGYQSRFSKSKRTQDE